jgi:very-short-patch-repair endonuclease
MSSRPFSQQSLSELENLFMQHQDDPKTLSILLDELLHRTRRDSIALRGRVSQRLDQVNKRDRSAVTHSQPGNRKIINVRSPLPNESEEVEANPGFPAGMRDNRDPSAVSLQEKREVTRRLLADLRTRLLDLRNNNRLLNFPFSERSRTHVRVIDELPDVLHNRLRDGKTLIFAALPQPAERADDEQTDEFQLALEAARISDQTYLRQVDELGEKDDITSVKGQRIERALRDRIREKLVMPPRSSRETMSAAEYATTIGLNPSYELPTPDPSGNNPRKHEDDKIQTLLFPDQMERKLSGLRDQTHTGLVEMGINTLFCAFGFLEWYESPDSDKGFLAPLLLHPIQMERGLVRQVYRYSIQSTGEPTEINLPLRERLRHDFAIELPQIQEDDTPETYFEQVTEMIEELPRWRVRRFVTVGLFHFARLVMYHDLDPERWPSERSLREHGVLVDLLGGIESGNDSLATEYCADQPEVSKVAPILITDADSSQFSAIVDIMSGKNAAIKGPPGTGKSQTITNVIAAALNANMRVLFLAEKMAALEVVKKRLDDAGLGVFCLELHSTKARKIDVHAALRKRDELTHSADPLALAAALEEHERLREQLAAYANRLNQSYGKTGKTIQELLWAEQANRRIAGALNLPPSLDRLYDAAALEMNEYDRSRAHSKLTVLERSAAALGESCGDIENHAWFGCCKADMSVYEQEDLRVAMRDWCQILTELNAVAQSLSDFLKVDARLTLETTRDAAEKIEANLPNHSSDVEPTVLANLTETSAVEALASLRNDCLRYQEVLCRLKAVFEGTPFIHANTREELNEVVRSMTILPSGVRSIGPEVRHLKSQAESMRDRAASFQRVVERVRQLYTAIHFEGPVTTANVGRLFAAMDILRSSPRETLLRRRSPLIEELSLDTLERGSRLASLLLSKRNELGATFVLKLDSDPAGLRQCALTVQTTGLPGRFGRRYKEALNQYRLLCRSYSKKRTRQSIVSDLGMIADYLDEFHTFLSDEKVRSVCGDEFRGLDTPFRLLLAASDYATGVRQSFKGNEPLETALRQFLLRAPIDDVDSVVAVATRPEVQSLRVDFEALVSDGETLHDLEPEYSTCSASAEALASMYLHLREMGVGDGVSLSALPDVAEQLGELENLANGIEQNTLAKTILGGYYRGPDSDCEFIHRHCQSAASILSCDLPSGCAQSLLAQDYHVNDVKLREFSTKLAPLLRAEAESRSRALSLGQVDALQMFSSLNIESLGLQAILARIDRAVRGAAQLSGWVDYLRTRAQVVECGAGQILDSYRESGLQPSNLPVAFDKVFYRSITRKALSEFPELKQFSGISHDAVRQSFQELDRTIIKLQRRSLAAKLSRADISSGIGSGPRSDWTDRSLIHNEIQKKMRHIPLRDLMKRAGRAIQQMKPCFMMSPASVAQFISPESSVEFDMVIIDEASQMKPEEALGSIVRGKQLVVVGDPQQLPPTSFFDRTEIPTDEGDDFEDYIDNESILDLALATFRPSRNLRWHYRSRHESLIAFSNKNFYDNELILFPSPTKTHRDLGVEYRKIKGIYNGRVNVGEAEAVVNEAISFMNTYPNRSLGIVTINQTQRELLVQEMDRVFARDRRAESYREKWEKTLEPFFVKNLENVQGDERDAIFISTVYGPNETGKVYQRFGPINSAAGHRRLNVLFTRAKEKVVVFSSMDSADIIPTDTSHRGVQILKGYIEYSRVGRLESGVTTGRSPDSDFEVVVADRLRQNGFEAVPQVGVAGYFIDMAVRDPNNPDSYILGIECDGATYHSAKSTRDRDRLREEVLRGLKWNIYRIWSTDWFNDQDGQVRKLVSYLHSLCHKSSAISKISD